MDQAGGFDQIPQTIGRYEVQGAIGFGAMGAVYKAFDPRIKRLLAIKTIRLDIPRQSPEYKTFIERFYHEARISGTLSHPNIVTLFDIGEERGVPYLAMEYVEGETLAAIIDRGERFAPEKVIALVSQIASAVDYAHTKGVVHRDIKPSNLILYEGERVKVTDFGIAKMVDTEMTQQGQMLGTPSYMSPEQAMGEKVDGRTDIFSLGVCAFEMLSGEQPFPGANVTAILYKLVHADPIEPANLELRGLVPQKWHEVFRKVLAKKPDERYQNGADFVRDLEYCLGSWFGAAMSDETLAEPAPTPAASPDATATLRGPDPPPVDVTLPANTLDRRAPNATLPPTPPASSATVLLTPEAAAPPSGATVLIPPTAPASAPSGATVLIPPATPAPPVGATMLMSSAPPGRPPEGPTVAMPVMASEATVRAPVPSAASEAAARVAGAPARPATAPVRPAPTRPAATGGGGKAGLVVGVIGLFLIVGLAVAGWLWWRGRQTEPVAEASPSAPPVASAEPSPSAAPALGAILVDSDPQGASVSVNGEPRGVTPLRLSDLPLDSYALLLERSGYEPFAQTVALSESSPVAELRPVLRRAAPAQRAQATLTVLSTPFGAGVSIGGTVVGQTPLTNLRLRPGTHQIELRKAGYEPWTRTLEAQAGQDYKLDAPLKALPAAPTPAPVATVDPDRVYANTANEVDTPARKLSGASVSYPSRAPRLRSGESVSVRVAWVVDEAGRVTDVTVVESGGKLLDDAVVSTVKTWTYAPAVKRGVKVRVRIELRQTFRAG